MIFLFARLRAACEAEGPRTVIFRVGGTIHLKSRIVIHNPYLTVAGQTAPGDGICLRGYSFGILGGHDIIIRYLRLRVGDESGKTLDGMGARGGDHVIYDHCSISWSIDEGFSSREARNLTFQRSIIAEALNLSVHSHYKGTGKGHSFGGEYLELVPFEKIRYSDHFDDPNLPGTIQVTVTLKKVSCGTDVHIVQEGLPDVIPVEQCYLGWQDSLRNLAMLVEPEINM